MGFLTNLAVNAGNAMIYGQQYQERQAELDLKKQQVAMGNMAMQRAQQQQQTQQAVGQFLSSEFQKDQAAFTDPTEAAKLYEKGSAMALQNGDFTTANTMSELAKGKLGEAKEQMAVQATQAQQKKEQLSAAADDYDSNPTPEGAKDLMQKAVAAGQDPTRIPMPGTAQWETWKNQQKMASMNGKEKMQFVQKAAEAAANREEKLQIHADNVALHQAQMQATAASREATLEIARGNLALRREAMLDREANRAEHAPTVKEFTNGLYQFDPSMKLAGDRDLPDNQWVKMSDSKLTAQQKGGVSRGSFAAAEITRALGTSLKFDPGTTTGPFAHLGASTPTQALAKVGSNKLTPAQFQAMGVNAAGLGNQIASLDSALGGRMAAGTQQQHLQDMAVPAPGDSGYTALFKIANAKELTKTALEHLPGHYAQSADGKKQLAELEQAIPFDTTQIIDMMKKDPSSKKDDAAIRQLVKDSAKARSNIAEAASESGGVGLPGSGTGNAVVNAPPLPSGWSVKEH